MLGGWQYPCLIEKSFYQGHFWIYRCRSVGAQPKLQAARSPSRPKKNQNRDSWPLRKSSRKPPGPGFHPMVVKIAKIDFGVCLGPKTVPEWALGAGTGAQPQLPEPPTAPKNRNRDSGPLRRPPRKPPGPRQPPRRRENRENRFLGSVWGQNGL